MAPALASQLVGQCVHCVVGRLGSSSMASSSGLRPPLDEDDNRLIDLRLGARRWMKVTSKEIMGIAWKMEAAKMATGQQEHGSDTI
ncbi:hypothetical protein B296_00001315 [Ensete ventricosum]|uniref:Uncharacterized protein n=1 Tax=Ensete ventricosum TaxID=4639 RepID=A0A427B1J9_ENSVE|nr:hypothetical protein B296_00001315 [Ensete ventricosum]